MAKVTFLARRIDEVGVNGESKMRLQVAWTALELRALMAQGLTIKCADYKYLCTDQNEVGEQRLLPTQAREKKVLEIANYILQGFPTESSVDLSFPPEVSSVNTDVINLKYPMFVTVTWDTQYPLYATDGWHRILGFLKAIDLALAEGKPLDFYITALLARRTPLDRIIAFVIQNACITKQSGNLLAWHRAEMKRGLTEEQFDMLPYTVRKNSKYILAGRAAVELMNRACENLFTGNILHNKITMPNDVYDETRHHLSCNGVLEQVMPYFGEKSGFLREKNFNPDTNYAATAKNVALTVVEFFGALAEIVPNAINDKQGYGLFKAHAGSICMLLLLSRLMRLPGFTNTIPKKGDFVKLLKKAGDYMTPKYWQTDNINGYSATGGLHGKAAALKVAKRIFNEIKLKLPVDKE